MKKASLLALTILAGCVTGGCSRVEVIGPSADFDVTAAVETKPVPSGDDAADDPAIWVHPTAPQKSRIIGTDKQSGIVVYDLAGNQVQFDEVGRPNNVDVRYGFSLGGAAVDIAATENRTDNKIVVYTIDAETGELTRADDGQIQASREVYGFGLYHSRGTGKYYAFVGSKAGVVEQFELMDDGNGKVAGKSVRTIPVGGQVEGIVADDVLGFVYIGEEEKGLWKFPAEPDQPAEGKLVSVIGPDQPIRKPDLEGVTIYYSTEETGYIICSSQGMNEYVVLKREGENEHVCTFRIVDGETIDGAQETDGLDVTSAPLGPRFPKGIFVVQDGMNGESKQNFKVVPWQRIANQGGLAVSTLYDVRGGQ